VNLNVIEAPPVEEEQSLPPNKHRLSRNLTKE
jgi:hypothetical protein